ncbi:hypothetical protein ABNO07_003574 [Salmonella enterica subsp. enterica serovar Bareilly]
MGNYVPKAEHASSYWQEVEKTMATVNALTPQVNKATTTDPKVPVVEVSPQGHKQKPGGLNTPVKAQP